MQKETKKKTIALKQKEKIALKRGQIGLKWEKSYICPFSLDEKS